MKYTDLSSNEVLPTNSQLEVIKNNTYPLYITAQAGTGKTETLIQKVLYILKHDNNASLKNMVIISFTNKATDELKQRIFSSLYCKSLSYHREGKTDIANRLKDEAYIVNISNISTIHIFCENLLREYGIHINCSPTYKTALSSIKVNDIISEVVRQSYLKENVQEIPEITMISLISKILGYNNNCGIYTVNNTYRNISTPLGKLRSKFIDIYNDVVLNIENTKLNQNILNLNDSIVKATELLKNEYVREKVKSRYKYIFIDEYQDTNIPQYNFTKELIDIGINVFLVGDEKQAIYEFRGSEIENSKQMHKYISKLNNVKLSLNENFRSDPKVIDAINQIFTSNIKFYNQLVDFDKSPLLTPNCKKISEDNPVWIDAKNNIVDIIKNIKREKSIRGNPISYSDIAILCRNNYMIDSIGEACKAAGIPVEIIGGHGFYKTKEVIDIYKFFNYIVYKRNEYKKELYLTDAYNSFINYDCGSFDKFLENLCENAKNNSANDVIDYIIENTMLEQYYMNNSSYQAISNLSKLSTIANNTLNTNFTSALNFLDFISRKINNEAEEDEAPVSESNRKKGIVSLYTIHKAKGLSFPVVIIANTDKALLNPKKFPKAIMECKDGKTAIGFSETIIGKEDIQYKKLLGMRISKLIEEELRLLYVACTRAKHMLVFSSNTSINKYNQQLQESWLKWIIESGYFNT